MNGGIQMVFLWAIFVELILCVYDSVARRHTHTWPNDDNNQCVIWWWLIKRHRHTNTCHCLHHHVVDVCACFSLCLSINSGYSYSNMIIWNQQQSKILAHISRRYDVNTLADRQSSMARSENQREANTFIHTLHTNEKNNKRDLLVKTFSVTEQQQQQRRRKNAHK